MKRLVIALMLLFVASLGFQAVTVPANAGTNCTQPLCGDFNVLDNVWMDEPVYIAHNWCAAGVCADGERAYVYPGQSTSQYWKDTDGVWVPNNRDFVCAWYDMWSGWVVNIRYAATGWHKITNDFDGVWCGYQYRAN